MTAGDPTPNISMSSANMIPTIEHKQVLVFHEWGCILPVSPLYRNDVKCNDLLLSLTNPLQPGGKSRMKILLEQRW